MGNGGLMDIITRAEAKARGLTRYFTGKLCKRGHVAENAVPTVVAYRGAKPRVKIGRLYPEMQSETKRHAVSLLTYVQKTTPHVRGTYVPWADLQYAYKEMCRVNGWKAKSWLQVARPLGCISHKKRASVEGKRVVCYRIW